MHPCENKQTSSYSCDRLKVWTTPGIGGQLMGPTKPLYHPQSWSRTNNTFRLVILAMVVGSRQALSSSSVLGPLQNIYPLPCCWKDNSPLVHHRSVTKKEWISPSMSQRIERGAPAHTQIDVYIDRSPREKGVRTHTRYSNIY